MWNTAISPEECDLQNACLPRKASEESVLYFFHILKKKHGMEFLLL